MYSQDKSWGSTVWELDACVVHMTSVACRYFPFSCFCVTKPMFTLLSYIYIIANIMLVLTLRWHLVILIKQQNMIYLHNTYNFKITGSNVATGTNLAKDNFITMGSTILQLQNKTLDTKVETILSHWHDILAKHARLHTTLFLSTPNFLILKLCSYRPSC